MAMTRQAAPGATRVCPHCRQSILESAVVCPVCRHHLRVGAGADAAAPAPTFAPLRVEGTIRHAGDDDAWEYAIMVSIVGANGKEISRQLMGVGALQGDDERTFVMAVEVYARKPGGTVAELRGESVTVPAK
jgi:hypothetical protein